MLINPDHVQYMNDEYERRLTAFRLERKLRKAHAAATPKLSLAARCMHLLFHWTAAGWQRSKRDAAHQPAQRWQTLPSGK